MTEKKLDGIKELLEKLEALNFQNPFGILPMQMWKLLEPGHTTVPQLESKHYH